MAAEVEVSVASLLEQRLEKAKEHLEDVEENIRKLTGGENVERRVSVGDTRMLVVGEPRRISGDRRRISGEVRTVPGDMRRISGDVRRLSGDQRRQAGDQRSFLGDQRRISMESSMGAGRGRGLGVKGLSLMERLGAPPMKRNNLGSPFSRLGNRVGPRRRAPSDDEEEDMEHKPAIQSSVVATQQTRTRQQSIKDQQRDKNSLDRNKRMFGHLLGTLQRFRDENDTKTDKEKRRKEIEKKLEEKAVEEKKAVNEEKKQLLQERRDKQEELDRLEKLVELTQEHKEWDAHTLQLTGFIRTKGRPHIYYRPAKWTLGTEKLLRETKIYLNSTIEKRKAELERKVAQLEGKKEKEEKKEDQEEDARKDRRRSGEERRRRHSHRDEVKGKKDDKEVSRREDGNKKEKEERRESRGRKRSRHEEGKERTTADSEEVDRKVRKPSKDNENEKESETKERTDEEEKPTEIIKEEEAADDAEGKDEGKYEEGEKMEVKKDEEEVVAEGEGGAGGAEEGAQDGAKEEGVGEEQGLADDAWGTVGWGDDEEGKTGNKAAAGQVDDPQNEQEQLDYIYDDL